MATLCLVIVFLGGFYGLFMAAAVSVSRSRTQNLESDDFAGRAGRGIALRLLSRREDVLLAMQAARVVVALAIGAVAHQLSTDHGLAFEIILLIAALAFAMLPAEVGRARVIKHPEKSLIGLTPIILPAAILLAPFILLVRFVVCRVFALDPGSGVLAEEDAASAGEISEIIDKSRDAGEIEEGEREMIQSVFDFSETVVREIMIPRSDIRSVKVDATLDEVRRVFSTEGMSRLLVIGDSIEDVKGLINVRDLLRYVGRSDRPFRMVDILREPYFVPNTKKVDDLFHEMRMRGVHFAVVLDEHGSVDGAITIEDMLEELVGEIHDEFDRPDEDFLVRRNKQGEFLIRGGMLVEDLNNEFELNLPVGDYDTIAGMVMHNLGRLPAQGEVIEVGEYKIYIEVLSQNRILLLRLTPRKSGQNTVNSPEPNPSPEDSNSGEQSVEKRARLGNT